MPVDLPTEIEHGTVSTRIRSEIGRRALRAVGLGQRVVESDHAARHHRWNDTFEWIDVTYLAGGTCAGLEALTASLATE